MSQTIDNMISELENNLWDSNIPLSDSALKYLQKYRRLSPETIRAFQLGLKTRGEAGRITLPYFHKGRLLGYTSRALHDSAACKECGVLIHAKEMNTREYSHKKLSQILSDSDDLSKIFIIPSENLRKQFVSRFSHLLEREDAREFIEEPIEELCKIKDSKHKYIDSALISLVNEEYILNQTTEKAIYWPDEAKRRIQEIIKIEGTTRQEVLRRVDLLKYLKDNLGVSPIKDGDNKWVMKCPFHESNNLDFKIRVSKNNYKTWHCHGQCNKGGDLVDFITLQENYLDQDMAIALLNKIYSLGLERSSLFDWRECPSCSAQPSKAQVSWLARQFPKYLTWGHLNTSEQFYRAPVSDQKPINYICEGYFDAFSLHEIGLENVAATANARLSGKQATELLESLKKDPRITLCFDLDPAGQIATQKSIEQIMLINKKERLKLEIRVVNDYGKDGSGKSIGDPADALSLLGPKALLKLIQAAPIVS